MNTAYTLVIFAFCINGMIFALGMTIGNTFLINIASSGPLNPTTQTGTGGTMTSILNETSSQGNFFSQNLLGNPILALQMTWNLLSGGYLITLLNALGGFFNYYFVIPLEVIMFIINIVTSIQLVRGINAGI